MFKRCYKLAKICFYCGKELNTGEKCNCRTYATRNSTTAGKSSESNAGKSNSSNEKEMKKKQKQFEKERKAREKQRAKNEKQGNGNSYRYTGYTGTNNPGGSGGGWQPKRTSFFNFFYKFMTDQGFSKNDPLYKKIGYSLLHTFFRPVSSIDAFILNKDRTVSAFYLVLFAVSGGFLSMQLLGNSLISFVEGMLMSTIMVIILAGLLMLSFRFFTKVKYSFLNMLSTFSASLVFVSLFFLIASTGRGSVYYFATTIFAGISSGSILHYLSLKKFSGLDNDRLVANIILVYFIFYSIAGFILSLALTTAV